MNQTAKSSQPSRLGTLCHLCHDQMMDAQRSGLIEKYRHLRQALRALQAADRLPPPEDDRQHFFAVMLERPGLL